MKTVDFSETIAVCNLKDGRCTQLIELMKVCLYSWSKSFLDLGPRSFTLWKLKLFSQKLLNHFNQIVCVSFYIQGNEYFL